MRLVLLFLLTPLLTFSQVSDDVQYERIAEQQFTSSVSDDELIGAVENFTESMVHKKDLNSCTEAELKTLGFSQTQIKNLADHRNKNGKLLSFYELQSIDGFDVDFLRTLEKSATVRDPSTTLDKDFFRRVQSESYNYLLLRTETLLQSKAGFTTENEHQRFKGGRSRVSFRMRSFRAGDFSFGITAENDAGEAFRWKPSSHQYGFDFTAFHVQLQNKGRIRNIIAGDFQAQFGQGLVWGGAMAFGKGAEPITNIRRVNIGLVPYTSAYEGGGFHGVGSSITINKNISAHMIVSSSQRDASINYSPEGNFISSIQNTGLHRNDAELSKRKKISQEICGGTIEYTRYNLVAGITLQYLNFGVPVLPYKNLHNQFSFSGKMSATTSAYVSWTVNNFTFFSEVARNAGGGSGLVAGSMLGLTPKLDVAFLIRNYQRDYISFFSNAFSESTTPNNERGFYYGWKYKVNRKFFASGYFDVFSFPWLKYRVYAPSRGNEWLFHFHWQPVRTTNLFFQVRQENKVRNAPPGSNKLYEVSPIAKNSYWINADYQLSRQIRMKTRIQWSSFIQHGHISEGFAFAQDVTASYGKFKITGRYALFQTDDYDNRLYMYENDVWLAYSLPAYYGQGIRRYLLLQYKINKTCTFWIRYSTTEYTDKRNIGSGVEMIQGNKQNDIKFEARIQF